MGDLKIKLKEQLIEHLNLEDFSIKDIADDLPLFGDGLGLDSIDALEIIVMLDNKFNVIFCKKHFNEHIKNFTSISLKKRMKEMLLLLQITT